MLQKWACRNSNNNSIILNGSHCRRRHKPNPRFMSPPTTPTTQNTL
jgi:hypothetical protein